MRGYPCNFHFPFQNAIWAAHTLTCLIPKCHLLYHCKSRVLVAKMADAQERRTEY